jgi:hypothetical protein
MDIEGPYPADPPPEPTASRVPLSAAPTPPAQSAGSNSPLPADQWWWSMTAVVVVGLLVIVGLAVGAMVLDTKDAGTIAGAAFAAVGTLVTAFIGLKSTQNQANSAAVFAAHVPEDRADIAIRQAGMRRQSG